MNRRPDDWIGMAIAGAIVAVFVASCWAVSLLFQAPAKSKDTEGRRRRVRLAALFAAFVPWTFSAVALAAGFMPPPERRNLPVSFSLSAIFFLVGLWLYVRRLRNAEEGPPPKPTREEAIAQGTAVPAWGWLLVVATIAGITFFWRPEGRKPGAAPPPNGGGLSPALWICPGAFAAMVALAFGAAYVRYRRAGGPAIARAFRKSEGGDVDGAIADIRGEIERRGDDVQRLNALGMLLVKQGDPGAAIAEFKAAMALAPDQRVVKQNLAIAIQEAGDPASAEAILAELIADPGLDSKLILCNHAQVLIVLGRLDEAETQLDRAEEILAAETSLVQRRLNRAYPAMIAGARSRLAEARGVPKATGPDDL